MISPFPTPTALIDDALTQLLLASAGELEPVTAAVQGRLWDPATCPPALRREIWYWLDEVVAWLNREHTWQPEQSVPGCWPTHPHIVHELAVVACQRVAAGQATTADRLDEWHRYTLPLFLERTARSLRGACTPGKHRGWPAANRYAEYVAAESVDWRRRVFADDTEGVDALVGSRQ